jgi:hypothetical protein
MTIVALVGAPGSGKSTLAAGLAAVLDAPVIRMDVCCRTSAAAWGYSTARAERIFAESGSGALHQYESRFELIVLEQLVHRCDHAVIDCSGGVVLQRGARNRARLHDVLARVDALVTTTPTASPGRRTETLVLRLLGRSADPYVAQWLARGGERLLGELAAATDAVVHPHRYDVVTDRPEPVLVAELESRLPRTSVAKGDRP